jgi:hypothetical protein
MRTNLAPPRRFSPVLVVLLVVLLVLAVLAGGCAAKPQTFDAPERAADALWRAARAGSSAQVEQILGGGSQDVVSSGDPVADQQALHRFAEAYEQKHQLVPEDEGRVNLVVGADDWPLPIPIVREARGGKWYFDTEAGRDEIINRRIGRNELDAIEVCLAIADAQREYARLDPQGAGVPLYATKFASSPGARDGLYWPTREDEPPSPLGPLVADAARQGYRGRSAGEQGPRPYRGYLYRILTAQGASAPGGAFDYMINGRLLGGFGIVAFPAEYGNSGIMTFIVNHEGVVYERDLGDDTDRIASEMVAFDPDKGWRKARAADDKGGFAGP